MEPDRPEVYERIPWETLEKKGGDRQWLVYGVAGAVVLGALAYSFMRNQPTAPPPPPEAASATTAPATPPPPPEAASATTAPATTTASEMAAPPSTVPSPLVVAEADLYAVDPEMLKDQAASHAEWFTVEYVAYDGSEESRETLSALLPDGLPLTQASESTQVFVDWARSRSVTPVGPASFEVDVLVRSLVSSGESGFVRQPPLLVTVPVEIDDDGAAVVAGVPAVAVVEPEPPPEVSLVDVPEDVAAEVESQGAIVGGVQSDDGTWDVVVMAEWADGVRRPIIVRP